MSSISAALRQVKRQLVFVSLFTILLNSALIFSSFALLFVLINVGWLYAALPMAAYLVPMSIKRMREVKLKTVEEKIPELEWQLRTTEDTVGKENEVIDNLHQRVFAKLLQIKNSYLVNQKQWAYRGMISLGLLGLVAIFATLNVHPFDIAQPGGLTGFFAKNAAGGKQDISNASGNFFDSKQGQRDIYGDKDVATLGDEELKLELNRDKSDLDRNNLGDAQSKTFSQQSALGDIGASTDSSYKEHIDDENKKLVKNYFEKLAGVR